MSKKLILLEEKFALVQYEDGRVHRVNRETRQSESEFSVEDSRMLIKVVNQLVL